MILENVLVFDLWGDYGHFKRIETTTSPLTYLIPTGTSVWGLIASMLGCPRDSYYKLFSKENAKFAIRVLNPLKKIRINQNIIDTSKGRYLWDCGKDPRTLIPYEYVKDPKYRVYVWLRDKNLFKKLKTLIENHETIFTPYLGISELIANFSYVNKFDDVKPKTAKKDEIHSVAKEDSVVIVEEGKRYTRQRIPLYMNEKRVVQEYASVLLEINGKSMRIKGGEFYELGEDNVIFL